jgi:hypothetical protein
MTEQEIRAEMLQEVEDFCMEEGSLCLGGLGEDAVHTAMLKLAIKTRRAAFDRAIEIVRQYVPMELGLINRLHSEKDKRP